MAGEPGVGVRFALNEPVVIQAGPLAGTLGVVVSLVGLDPEPVYTVELGVGTRDVHVLESALDSA